MKRELKLFYTENKRKRATPTLEPMGGNSSNFSLSQKLLEKVIDSTNNAAGIVFSLFKSQYKVMTGLQIRDGAQAHFDLFTLRHNFRKFPRGKHKGYLSSSLRHWRFQSSTATLIHQKKQVSINKRLKVTLH